MRVSHIRSKSWSPRRPIVRQVVSPWRILAVLQPQRLLLQPLRWVRWMLLNGNSVNVVPYPQPVAEAQHYASPVITLPSMVGVCSVGFLPVLRLP